MVISCDIAGILVEVHEDVRGQVEAGRSAPDPAIALAQLRQDIRADTDDAAVSVVAALIDR